MSTQPHTGRLIAVVGPSGVGKDSVMEAVAKADPNFALVRRVITRVPEAGGEGYDAVSEAEFARLVEADAFCLHWNAHGLRFGIPVSIKDKLNSGQNLLVNLSRSVLTQADEAFPRFSVLNLTARPETLAARVLARGRESAEDVAKRLSRQVPALPPQLDIVTVNNDGALDETVQSVLSALASETERV